MLIKQAVSMCRETFGINHAKYADCLVDFGFYLLNIDSIAPSMQVYQNALEVRLNYFGGDNLRVAVAHEDLAYCSYVLEYSSGHFQDAKKHALSSLSICSKLLPEQHLLLASPKRVLALILEEIAIDNEQNPLEKDMMLRKAEELHLFALKMSISCFGERNVQTAKHHGNLGRLYQTMHRYSAAEEMHLKAIRIKEDLLGPDDYEVALSVGHLASLYNYDMKEFSKAEQLYIRSIRIGIKLFGPSYSGLEYDYRGLIQVYNATENQAKLEEFNNVLESWSILKEEKEVAEQDHGSVVDVKLSVSLTDLLNIVTSLPSLAAGSCSGASVVSRGLAPPKLAGKSTT
ncbi:amyloid protein-binding protein 2 [Eurytemora carolleeae]|uniref:amyloid protein-binding protein 2 n=1 Tax=Eurytemora carolleeae TaxID=1294199 RepID=UPI000C76A85D|nr:amyloid protein-binding protein 2 [Eurytemora carolleeae]|eukprot:XP_023333208.1 amyloid protein-binding protein 2-like [Eurytemora affinis]